MAEGSPVPRLRSVTLRRILRLCQGRGLSADVISAVKLVDCALPVAAGNWRRR